MAKYCVAFMTYFENVLEQHIVEATSEVDACTVWYAERSKALGYPCPEEFLADMRNSSLEGLGEMFFNMDANIHTVKVSD